MQVFALQENLSGQRKRDWNTCILYASSVKTVARLSVKELMPV